MTVLVLEEVGGVWQAWGVPKHGDAAYHYDRMRQAGFVLIHEDFRDFPVAEYVLRSRLVARMQELKAAHCIGMMPPRFAFPAWLTETERATLLEVAPALTWDILFLPAPEENRRIGELPEISTTSWLSYSTSIK